MQPALRAAVLLSLYALLLSFSTKHAFAAAVESQSNGHPRNIFVAVGLPDSLISTLNETIPPDQDLLDASDEPDISTAPILADREDESDSAEQEHRENPSAEVEIQSQPLGPQFQAAAVEEAELLQSPDASPEPFTNFALEQYGDADGGPQFSADIEETMSPQLHAHFDATPSFSEESGADDDATLILSSPGTLASSTSEPDFVIDEVEMDSFSPAPSFYHNSESAYVFVTLVTNTPTPHFTLSSQASAQNPQLHAEKLDSSPEAEIVITAIEGEGSIVAVTPSSLPSPTPFLLLEDVSALPSMSAEEGGEEVWAEVPLSVTRAENNFTQDIDASIRWYSANTTKTSKSNWRLVNLTEAQDNSIQRQQHTPILAVYHALLLQEDAGERLAALEEDSNDGSFETYLRERASDQSLTIKFAGTPFLNVVPEEDIAGEKAPLLPTNSNEADDNSKGGSDSSAKDPADGKLKIGIILASSLTGVAVIIACLVTFLHYRKKDPDRNHLIDGVAEIPSTISSVASTLTDSGSSIFNTGAPVRPRGPTMLHNQSRILDWQMEQHADNSLKIPASASYGHRRRNTEKSGYAEEKTFGRTEALSGEVID